MNHTSLALIIGIDYKNTSFQLDGCQYDALQIKQLLLNKFNFLEDNITLLTEDDPNPKNHPTSLNIMNNLGRLIIKAYNKQAHNLFIYFSGHGTYIKDHNHDESDGNDEAIVPLDVDTNRLITDDILHDYLEYIPENCNCFALFDCCHSGTLFDLKYKYTKNNRIQEENNHSNIKGNIIMISGCQDNQTSVNTIINNQYQGIMTRVFIDTLTQSNYQTTFFHLLDEMKITLAENGFTQYPLLTSSRQLNHTDLFCSSHQSIPMFTLTQQ